MSSPAPVAGGAAREHDAAGLSEPLLANGDGGFHDGALAAVAVANYAHGAVRSRAEEKDAAVKSKDGYWVGVHRRPAVADLESGGGRPLLFSNKKVMAALLYPYRCVLLFCTQKLNDALHGRA